MKTIPLLTFLIVSLSFGSYAQDSLMEDYNKFSVEANVGLNSPSDLFTPGTFTVNPDKYLNFNTIGHFNLGVRYMLNTKFGLKLDGAYDIIKPNKNNGSIPFESRQYRLGFQGVMNLGNVLDFRSFSGRLGLLVHAGLQVSRFEPISGRNVVLDVTEDNGGFIFGITPQFKISNRIILTTDATFIQNTRQHLTWDGAPVDVSESNLKSSMINFSAGVTVNFGKHDIHADWVDDSPLYILEEKLSKYDNQLYDNQLDDIESKLLDTDKDGVPDHLDECPDEAGLAEFDGCPDADGDGIPDHLDQCPEEEGPKENDGCPWPDSDADGVPDKDDLCPDEPGTVENQGCPDITEEEQKQLNEFAKTLNFESGKSRITDHSKNIINTKVLPKLKEFPNAKFIVEGHTDSTGSNAINLRLSKERAAAVKDYLIENGIAKSRLSSEGYGSAKPIASNKTNDGRKKNRRVEINLVK